MFQRIVLIALTVVLIVGCALPRDPMQDISFVSRKELLALSIMKDAQSYYSRGRFNDAEMALRQAYYLYPQAKNIRLNLAAALRETGQYPEALSMYKEMLAETPDSLDLFFSVAETHYAAHAYKDAQTVFNQGLEKGLQANALDQVARFARSLAVLHFERGEEEQALCYSSLALTLKPGPEELVRHGRLLNALGAYAKARELLHAAVAEGGMEGDARVVHTLSMSEFALKNYDETIRLGEKIGAMSELDATLASESQFLESSAKRLKDPQGTSFEVVFEKFLVEGDSSERIVFRPAQSALLYWPTSLVDVYRVLEEKLRT